MSRRGIGKLPTASRIVREEDPEFKTRFLRQRPKARLSQSKAAWSYYFQNGGTRLVLAVDLSHEATAFRNALKKKYFHPWGYFPDTRFRIIDPLPDRYFYVAMYKDAINEFCTSSPPLFQIGPSTNLFVSQAIKEPGLLPIPYSPGKQHNKPNHKHHMIAMSFPRGMVLHRIRQYFLKQFGNLPNEEIQTAIQSIRETKYKAQIPLGYSRDLGPKNAELSRQQILLKYKEAGGIHLGHAVSLSLWRQHYAQNPIRQWDAPVIVNEECVYSRVFDGIQQSSGFVSIAPEAGKKENEQAATESEPGTKIRRSEIDEGVYGAGI